MPAISKRKAIEALTEAFRRAPPDELAEIHNELYPEDKVREPEVRRDPATVTAKIQKAFDEGLEVETIVDLWNVVFPEHRQVRYDEETNKIHYEKAEQAVWQDD